MKLRESGMPEEGLWETLFDVGLILDRLGIDDTVQDVVEPGCGYGTFTLPIAGRITGHLDAFDIDPAMLERTRQRAAGAGLTNVVCQQRDVFLDGFGVGAASRDVCLLFDILHCENPVRILTEAARTVRSEGFVHVIHWRRDVETPRGPSMSIRPGPEQTTVWALETGLLELDGPVLDLPPWHYGVRLRHRAAE
ncbi:MAG: methyltransferase domain-containing protein [Chloroflexi bacterium]|nr:methyltransferase domain-containing protein [Chloroflexota bacterium]